MKSPAPAPLPENSASARDKPVAVLHSVGANAQHGQRRTNADKRKAVMTLLNDEEWGQWSDREIARQCAVSKSFVNKLRPSLSTMDSEKSVPRTYTTKHGTVSTMNTQNIGRQISRSGLAVLRSIAE